MKIQIQVFIVILLYFIINNIFYLNVGFLPDESNFLFTTEKMLEGYAPYKDYSTDVKPPLNYYLFSFFLYLGLDNLYVIRFTALLLNIISACILFVLVSKLYSRKTALFSVMAFLAVFSMPSIFGYSLSGDRLLILFSIISLLFFYTGLGNKKNLVYSGLFLGLAAMSKQTAVSVLVFYFIFYIFILCRKRSVANLKYYSSRFLIIVFSSVIPLVFVIIHFYSIGALSEMLNWTTVEVQNIRKDDTWLNDPAKFTALETLYTFGIFSPFFLLSAVMLFIFLIKIYRNNDTQSELFLTLLLVTNLYPFIVTFRYVTLMIIPVVVLASLAVEKYALFSQIKNYYFKIIFVLVIGILVIGSAGLNLYSVYRIHSTGYLSNKDQIAVSKYLVENVGTDEKIYVFGYSPEIYYYSGRDPPTGLYYVYPYREHVNQTEQLRTIEILKRNNVTTVVVDTLQQSRYFNPITYAYIIDAYDPKIQIGRFDVLTKD